MKVYRAINKWKSIIKQATHIISQHIQTISLSASSLSVAVLFMDDLVKTQITYYVCVVLQVTRLQDCTVHRLLVDQQSLKFVDVIGVKKLR
jgi:hypothetical protein